MRLSVIGTGYLGAVHAACMAELGFDVVGVDTDPERVATLASGRAPFHEPGLDALLARHTATRRLRFTTSLAEAAEVAEVHFVCVGTPQGDGGAADLRAVDAVVGGLGALLRRPALVVGKSTVPVGTARRLRATLRAVAPAGTELAWNPEFLREGHGVHDTLRPDRLVVGVAEPDADLALRAVYADLVGAGVPWVATDLETAELAKVAANAFLATKISFANAMAELCDASGADITDLTHVLGLDPRIGSAFLGAGLGFGGGCLPKDVRALVARGEQLGRGSALGMLREVDAVNARRRSALVEDVVQLLDGLEGRRIGVLGASFKPGSDDVRDSPALDVACRLQAGGAVVTVHDPQALATARAVAPTLRYAADPLVACRDADAVLHLTAWPEYATIAPADLAAVTRGRLLVDARHGLDLVGWRRAGWRVHAPGRPRVGGQRAVPVG